MVDDTFKAQVDAYVDEVWEDVVEDIRALVRHESVEDLAAAEPGMPWGPASRAALTEAEGIARRLGLEVTDVDGYMGFGDVPGASAGATRPWTSPAGTATSSAGACSTTRARWRSRSGRLTSSGASRTRGMSSPTPCAPS